MALKNWNEAVKELTTLSNKAVFFVCCDGEIQVRLVRSLDKAKEENCNRIDGFDVNGEHVIAYKLVDTEWVIDFN